MAPDPSPILWLQPSSLLTLPTASPVFTWADSSYTQDDAVNLVPATAPPLDLVSEAYPGVSVNSKLFHTLLQSIILPGDYAVYAVAIIAAGFGGPTRAPFLSGAPGAAGAPLVVASGSLTSGAAGAQASLATDANYGFLHIWGARAVGLNVVFSKDGLVKGIVPRPVARNTGGAIPGSTSATGGRFPLMTFYELQVFNGTLSDAGEAAVLASLRSRYGF